MDNKHTKTLFNRRELLSDAAVLATFGMAYIRRLEVISFIRPLTFSR
ncbi:MAG: hypothetical protein QF790_10185 [Gammaproteobacteria bacterium]|jgi:hypothetical protein|nr:hypothetical protein [Gammaproteobacteria bacterium]MDP6617520.1 hypothetical protein [Gammaproteobacteria bacterium]MDP6694397.1 hypothetical protein [Gammaproteobacteria bacterium]